MKTCSTLKSYITPSLLLRMRAWHSKHVATTCPIQAQQIHAGTHAPHTCAHARMHARTHIHARTHKNSRTHTDARTLTHTHSRTYYTQESGESADDAAAEGDGMAVTLSQIRNHYVAPPDTNPLLPATPPTIIPPLSPPPLLSNILPVPNNGGGDIASSSGSESDEYEGVNSSPFAPSRSSSSSSAPYLSPLQQQQVGCDV